MRDYNAMTDEQIQDAWKQALLEIRDGLEPAQQTILRADRGFGWFFDWVGEAIANRGTPDFSLRNADALRYFKAYCELPTAHVRIWRNKQGIPHVRAFNLDEKGGITLA